MKIGFFLNFVGAVATLRPLCGGEEKSQNGLLYIATC
jgi:hypothetical protein